MQREWFRVVLNLKIAFNLIVHISLDVLSLTNLVSDKQRLGR